MRTLFITLLFFSTAAFSSVHEKDALFYPEKTPANTRLLLEDVIAYFGLSATLDTPPTKAGLLSPEKSYDIYADHTTNKKWREWIETELKDFKDDAPLDEKTVGHILWGFIPHDSFVSSFTFGNNTVCADRIKAIPPYFFLLNTPERHTFYTSHEVEFFPNSLRFMTHITYFRSGDFRYKFPGKYTLGIPDNLALMPGLKSLKMTGDHDSFEMTPGILVMQSLEILQLGLSGGKGIELLDLSYIAQLKSLKHLQLMGGFLPWGSDETNPDTADCCALLYCMNQRGVTLHLEEYYRTKVNAYLAKMRDSSYDFDEAKKRLIDNFTIPVLKEEKPDEEKSS
ncbi:MAG TPA: hypothetical protein DD412_04180 [Holosporales bacterium]|nr:hypothetical protein [Holosporales bacterium]